MKLSEFDHTTLPAVEDWEVAGFRMTRNFFNRNLFSVHAVDKNGELLVCMAPDLSFDDASALVEVLNRPYDEMIQKETELIKVQVNGQPRIFTAVKN